MGVLAGSSVQNMKGGGMPLSLALVLLGDDMSNFIIACSGLFTDTLYASCCCGIFLLLCGLIVFRSALAVLLMLVRGTKRF